MTVLFDYSLSEKDRIIRFIASSQGCLRWSNIIPFLKMANIPTYILLEIIDKDEIYTIDYDYDGNHLIDTDVNDTDKRQSVHQYRYIVLIDIYVQ